MQFEIYDEDEKSGCEDFKEGARGKSHLRYFHVQPAENLALSTYNPANSSNVGIRQSV
jgi:hypothetical protein